jgi:hypothetical protein
MAYFAATRGSDGTQRIGTEIETFFLNDDGAPITIAQSQAIMQNLRTSGWIIAGEKGDMVTVMRMGTSLIQYELGYPNIELSVCPYDDKEQVIGRAHYLLDDLYRAAERCGAYPSQSPIFGQSGNYLALPDDRDATWLELDGKQALSPLARISAVQFTINVPFDNAIAVINRLQRARESFLGKYPQDRIWREYVASSNAGYRADRYGGPNGFNSLEHYCDELSRHAVVSGTTLVPFEEIEWQGDEDITLFLRSVWWYFRLRRYGRNLCVEVRPIPRRRDGLLRDQLDEVLSVIN